MQTLNGKVVDILLVEDNPGDVELVREALTEAKVRNELHVAVDGEKAIEFLKGSDPCPDLILLDLNLPRKNGREVLQDIKSDPRLSIIPVVVLTSSKEEEDIIRSYRLHANCYITKPVDLEQFLNVVKSIENFWLAIVKLPCDVGK
jgi:chemotaxis family two-component system response regulator Rcp1